MIEVKELVKSFDGFRALDGLNMNVPKGAVYGLVGPNGAGKSTAIRHMAGIYRQDSGEVLIDGEPVYENPELKGRIAYIPDEIFYFTQARIKDMAVFYSGVYPRFSMERFEKLGAAFGLDANRTMRKLSKGMQKQAAFWLALAQCPDIVITRRTGGRTRPRDAQAGVGASDERGSRERHDGRRIVAQSQRA